MMSPLPDVFAEAARAEVHSLHQIYPTGITFNAGPPAPPALAAPSLVPV
mgnify:CR=1 FL=1